MVRPLHPPPWPPCPQPQNFEVITGFITPGSDYPTPPPHPLDASIAIDVRDPTEILPGTTIGERVRIVETTAPWDLEVDWCICGPFAAGLAGCWCVQVFINPIDGVEGPTRTRGQIGSARVDLSTAPPGPNRCYENTFHFPAGSVLAGVYDVVVLITLLTGACNPCDNPTGRLFDTLGYAEIPVLVFFDDRSGPPWCP
jgi:hypothetical protein